MSASIDVITISVILLKYLMPVTFFSTRGILHIPLTKIVGCDSDQHAILPVWKIHAQLSFRVAVHWLLEEHSWLKFL
jgi:hypothetical protein